MLLGALVVGHGCKPPTRDNPEVCDFAHPTPNDCATDKMCGPDDKCVPIGVGGGTGTGGAGTGGAGGLANGGGGDTGGTPGGGTGAPNGGAGFSGSGGAPSAGHAGGGTTGSGGLGGAAGGGGTDAGNHCNTSTDCQGRPGTPACEPTKKMCVACVTSNDCSGATPACDTSTNRCVECFGDDKWCTTPTKAFCGASNVCVGCDAKTNACMAPGSTKTVCGPSGACVQCAADRDCQDPTAPFCGSGKTCVSCNDPSQNASACGNKNAQTPVCGVSGACVQCGADKDCTSDATKPFCSTTGTCVGCGSAPNGSGACMILTPTKPACAPSGACVQCVTNTDCANANPVCSTAYSCGVCTTDSDCAAHAGPGVCMAQKDGSCATNSETIYVQTNGSCSDSGTGTSAAPFCTMQPAPAAVSGTRDLIVVRGTVTGATGGFGSNVAIVGQMSATMLATQNPALHVTGGTTYARAVKLSANGSVGLQADSGSTVQLDHLLVTQNALGGILLDGAAFDIRNTTVTDNGVGMFHGMTPWSGILVNMPPTGGSRSLQLVTVQDNMELGISCSAMITGTGVLVSGNAGTDISSACGFTSCGTAGMTCGAQP